MLICEHNYIPNKKEWDFYTKINLNKIQKIYFYLFNFDYYYKWNLYNKLKNSGTKRKELD